MEIYKVRLNTQKEPYIQMMFSEAVRKAVLDNLAKLFEAESVKDDSTSVIRESDSSLADGPLHVLIEVYLPKLPYDNLKFEEGRVVRVLDELRQSDKSVANAFDGLNILVKISEEASLGSTLEKHLVILH